MIGAPNLPSMSPEPQNGAQFSFPQEEEAGAGFTLVQLWLMVRAHLWLSIAIFVVMACLAFVAIKNLPKSYDATAALIVNSDNTDPLAGRNQGIGDAYSFFPTQVELIKNSVVLRPVVDRLNLQADQRFNGGFVGDPKTLNDIVLGRLRASLNVAPGAGSQLLYISAMSRDPVQAADIANAIADEYIRQNNQRTNAPAQQTADRYAEQLEVLKVTRDQAQAQVAEFRQRYGMADLGQDGNLESAAVSDLQEKLLQAQNATRKLSGKQGNPRLDATVGAEPEEALALRNTLDALENQRTKALLTMGKRNPAVTALDAQIETTKTAMRNSDARALAKAIEQESRIRADLKAEQDRLLDRRGVQDQGAQLVRLHKVADEAYNEALRGQDAVEFASKGNYQDVTLVSRAEPPVRSSRPNKLKLFAAAMAASLALALGGPFAYELLFNRRIRCRDDLERHFRIVMLAEFGRMKTA